MKLTNLQMDVFAGDLASNKPVPGGGSVSAFSAVEGISLGLMVSSLTLGREKYKESASIVENFIHTGKEIQQALLLLVDEDSASYQVVMDAFSLPKQTDDEKEIRKQAIHEGLIGAAKVPFTTMEKSLESLELLQTLVGKTNTNASSDLGVAAIQLDTALRGAWLNVLINVSGMDDERAVSMHQKGLKMVETSKKLSEEIFKVVEKSL